MEKSISYNILSYEEQKNKINKSSSKRLLAERYRLINLK
tara:strand:- start:575 stop:691 length:117 start_codon:yes stop_codon:yes gene_type:complete